MHGRSIENFRLSAAGLTRFIVTSEVSKHRFFVFVDGSVLPDGALIAETLDDAFYLGVLSSRIHTLFAISAGGRMGVGNDPRYNNSRCFDPFPFPDCTEKQKEKIRALAEELDAHRKRAQAQHGIGLTDLYNVLEKVRAGSARSRSLGSSGSVPAPANAEEKDQENENDYENENDQSPVLSPKEKLLHDQALVSTLRQLHDDLDAAVAAAYGWPWPLTDAEILERVVALNTARAAEEAKGIVRWLRPDYQKPLFAGEKQSALGLDDAETVGAGLPRDSSGKKSRREAAPTARASKTKTAWPKTLAERVRAVERALAAEEKPATAEALTQRFARAKAPDILEILQTLVTLGRARPGDAKGTFVR